MRLHCLSLLVLLAATGPLSLAAQSSSEQQRFAGTWEAKYKDSVICTIKLEAGEQISGGTYGCNIHVNEDGDLIETQAPEGGDESPIVSSKLEGDKLSFETKDGDDRLKFEFTLTGDRRAELRIVDAPMKIKPIRFDKR